MATDTSRSKNMSPWVSRLSSGVFKAHRLAQYASQIDGFVALTVVLIPSLLLISALWAAFTFRVISPHEFNACTTHECILKIPKIIHQTYKTEHLPDDWKDTPKSWNKTHPKWKYEFWTDDRNRRFIEEHYSWFLKQFDAYPNGIQRADAIRYFILYHYGGVYADLDIVPIRNIEPMLGDAELLLPETPNLGLTNAFMAATARNDFMYFLTTQLEGNANRWFHLTRHWQIITSTGPTFIWRMANLYTGPARITRIPASVWGKCLICGDTCPVVEGGYLRHLVGDSWHNWDSFLFTYVIFCHQTALIALFLFLFILITQRENCVAWMRQHNYILVFAAIVFFLIMIIS
eukprot:gene4544-8566_t